MWTGEKHTNSFTHEAGPLISMPGWRSSRGSGGTVHSDVVAMDGGSGPGMTPSSSAALHRARRVARHQYTRSANRDCSSATIAQNSA